VRKTVKKNVVRRAPRWRYDDRESTPEIRPDWDYTELITLILCGVVLIVWSIRAGGR